jgi:hypothetical protein
LAGTDECERPGGRTTSALRPTRSYTTLRDVTPADCLSAHAVPSEVLQTVA